MKAVLVLCEGRHEIVFVQRTLGAVAGCHWVKEPIRKLPSPFGTGPGASSKGLIARRIERDVDELTLRGAAYPPLPQFESAMINDGATLFILVRANGKSQATAVIDLLQDIDSSMDVGGMDVSEYAAAFLFDANATGLSETLKGFRRDYDSYFEGLANVEQATWIRTAKCPVGAFIFHKSATDETGTLEDHLVPMVESAWPDQYGSATDFIDGHKKPKHKVSQNEAARLKAIITSAGQFDHPGSTLSSIVARDGIPDEQFKESQLSHALVDFFQAIPWSDYPASVDAA